MDHFGLPEVDSIAIADVAQDPAAYAGEVIQLTGFIGESISPDATPRLIWATIRVMETQNTKCTSSFAQPSVSG